MSNKKLVSLGIFFWLLALILAFTPSWPHLYYRLLPQTSDTLASNLSQNPTIPPSDTPPSFPLPAFDPSLPLENGLIIDSIGVQGKINQGENWQNLLKQGIWHVPSFGTPEQNQFPTILAAHRWGYLSWTNTFRHLNSFYNLPKLKTNDEIIINWDQRQYRYQVYAEELSEQITDYSADLILYTCQLWNSPLRIIKYAKRI